MGAGQDSVLKEPPVIRKDPVTILREDIKSLLDNPDLSNAVAGIYVRSCKTGETIFKYNESKNLIPASLTKLFTTATALDYLKSDFKYSTKLYLDGDISKDGEFTGNIIIRAVGDPTLSEKFGTDINLVLDSWARSISAMGVKKINGNIICDDTYFDAQFYPPGWSVDDLIEAYAAPVSAVSVFDNSIKIKITAGDSVGMKASNSIEPENNFIRVHCDVLTVSQDKPEEISVARNKEFEIIEISGQIPFDSNKTSSTTVELPVLNPTEFLLKLFKEHLANNDIVFTGALFDYASAGFELNYLDLTSLTNYQSPPLASIIRNINTYSNNLAAEMLLKTVGKEGTGKGSFDSGIEMVKKFCSGLGIPSEKLILYDGSGLSRYNLVQPKYVVDLLFKIYFSKQRDVFINSLARPGREGTLKRRITNSSAEKRVFAKTGSMNNVSNLAGYVITADGEYLAFAIMISNFTAPATLAQNIQDLICMRLATFSRKE